MVGVWLPDQESNRPHQPAGSMEFRRRSALESNNKLILRLSRLTLAVVLIYVWLVFESIHPAQDEL